MFEDLGIGVITTVISLFVWYFLVKSAVKNGVKQAYRDITGKETADEMEEIEEIKTQLNEKKEK